MFSTVGVEETSSCSTEADCKVGRAAMNCFTGNSNSLHKHSDQSCLVPASYANSNGNHCLVEDSVDDSLKCRDSHQYEELPTSVQLVCCFAVHSFFLMVNIIHILHHIISFKIFHFSVREAIFIVKIDARSLN